MHPIIVILTATFVCLILLCIRRRKMKMSIFERCGIPGPKPNLFVGNAAEFFEKKNKCFDEWRKKYGNIYGFYLGGNPCIMCFDVELMKIVQIKEFKKFRNRFIIIPGAGISHELIMKSLPLLKDENWKNARSIITNCFSSGKIKLMSNLISDSINIFLEKVEEQKLKTFDVENFYKKLTFDVICKTAFGIKTNVQNEEINKFVKSVHKVFTVSSYDILVILAICFPELEPIPTYLRKIRDVVLNVMNYPSFVHLFDTCKKIVNERRQSGHRASDLLQILIEAEDDSNSKKRLTTEEIVGNAVLFMAAGYDTTSSTLSFCTHYLAHNPEIQEKLRREINDTVDQNRTIEYSDLVSFKYLDAVIAETLRLHPFNSISVNRMSSEDFKYKDITVPKGIPIMVPLPNLHTDENFWQEPEKFNPDRFFNKNEEANDTMIYQPFGAGPRSCVGMRMAQTVMKFTLANLIRTFKIEPRGNSNIEIDDALFVIHPRNGVNIKAIPITS